MKNFLALGLLALALCSCSKEEVETSPKEIELKLNYTFTESGSMTRAGSDVYNAFYGKHIKTKELTPKTYFLTFKSKESSATIMEVKGKWSDNNSIRLPEGDYTVAGYSRPVLDVGQSDLGDLPPSDSVYLSFSEDVRIVNDMTSLTLTALYDSSLLLFDKTNTENIRRGSNGTVSDNSPQLPNDGTNYWIFIRDKQFSTWTQYGYSTSYISLHLYRKDETVIDLLIRNLPLDKGKYYYFNDMTNSFDIPPMESGN